MPHYMTQFAYTSDAWAALAKNPQNREEVLRALVEKLGGRLVTFYYAFGEYDGVFITEMPDETTVTAAVLAAISPGHVKAIKTTVLLTTEQTMEAMRKAGAQSYRGRSGAGRGCLHRPCRWKRSPTQGDASIPSPLHSAPTRLKTCRRPAAGSSGAH